MAKKTTKREQKQNKQFVEKLLMLQGIDYDEWLDQLHLEYIQENNNVILNALEVTLNKQQAKEEKTSTHNESNESNRNNEKHEQEKHQHKFNK